MTSKEDHAARLKDYLENKPLLSPALRASLGYAIDCIENPQVHAVTGDSVEKMKCVRLINLLGDIVAEATNNPARLTSFNSPLLSLAVMEIFEHNNPDAPVDEKSKAIFRQMALVGYNG